VAASKDIIFSNIFKKSKDIQFIRENDINTLTVSTCDELPKISEHFPQAKLIIQMEMRPVGISSDFICKFPSSRDEFIELINASKKLGLNIVGINYHISQPNECSSYSQAILEAKELFALANESGYNFNHLGLCANFPGATGNTTKAFLHIADHLNKIIEENFSNRTDLKIFAEIGSFLATRSAILVSKIIAKKKFQDKDSLFFQYYVSEGTFSILPKISKEDDIKVNCLRDDDIKHPCVLLHSIGEVANVILNEIELPQLETEEWIYFLNSGCFTRTLYKHENDCYPEKKFNCAFIEDSLKHLPAQE
jgi:diaminopimelate decarboxylase